MRLFKAFGVLMAILMVAGSLYAAQIVPKLSLYDTSGSIDGGSGAVDVDPGYGISVEYLTEAGDNIMVGGGIEYQVARAMTDSNPSSEFNFAPVYLTGQYCFSPGESLNPFVVLNLGYNLIYDGNDTFKTNGDLEAGIYYAGGVGAVINEKIRVDLLYSSYAGKTGGSDTTYTKIGLDVGYVFDLGM
ncbi:outer membrane beta-barrel protein [Elusimicrobiota bacterium]